MKVIHARNVHQALPIGLQELKNEGIDRESRNGPVKVFKTPVTTVYQNPLERVLFWDQRDANPFFHFFESLWMLAGQNDVPFLAYFVKRMVSYSDDGKKFHGAYGHRWRQHFGIDQLAIVIKALKDNPDDRRCVVQMWDSTVDLGKQGKDFPCNTQVIFSRTAEGAIDMTVCNRSNDMVWGCYGANAVHFSFLQEFVAAGIGCPVGTYYQMSNNLHAYMSTFDQVASLTDNLPTLDDPYADGRVKPYPLCQTPILEWTQDLGMFMECGPIIGFRDPFFRRVVTPLWNAYRAYKDGNGVARYDAALEILQQCHATDWKLACEEWLLRRKTKFLAGGSNADGN